MIKLCAKYIRIGKKPFSSGCFLSFLSFADKSDAKCLKCKKAKIKRIVYLHLIKRLYFLGLLFVRHFQSYRFDDRSFTSFYYLSYICHANRTKLCRFCGHFRYFFSHGLSSFLLNHTYTHESYDNRKPEMAFKFNTRLYYYTNVNRRVYRHRMRSASEYDAFKSYQISSGS